MLKVSKVGIRYIKSENQINKKHFFIGVKELSRVVYSAERGKLETVLLKPGSGTKG